MKNLKRVLVLLSITTSAVMADPCTYLTKRQCHYEAQYCQFEPAVNRPGECVVKAGDEGDVRMEILCKAPNGGFWREKSEAQRSNYCYSNGCEWIPAAHEPSGCFLR